MTRSEDLNTLMDRGIDRLKRLAAKALDANDTDAAEQAFSAIDEINRSRLRTDLIRYTREILANSTDPTVSLQAINTLAKLEGLY